MDSKPNEPLVLCPAGFTVQRLDRYDHRFCGQATCYPSACQRLKQIAELEERGVGNAI